MIATMAASRGGAHLAKNTSTGLRVTQARVLRSEWTKFTSLRSTLYTLLVAVVLTVGFGALFAAVTANQYARFSPAELARFNPIITSLDGVTFSVLAVGVLGVLLMSGEYSTGMIRASLSVVPRRLPVLWGKLAVFTGVVLIVSVAATLSAFLLGQYLLSSNGLGVGLSATGAVRSVVGAALYLTVAGLIGVSLGALFRNTAAAISTFVAVFFVLPPLTLLLPASWTANFAQYLPSNAGGALFGLDRITNPLAPWTGFAVLCGYAAVLIGVAAWQLRRVDT